MPDILTGAKTGFLDGIPSFTFRLEIEPKRVVCLGPILESFLQLSRFRAETCIEHLRLLSALTATGQYCAYLFLPNCFKYVDNLTASSWLIPLPPKECEAFRSLPPFKMKSVISASGHFWTFSLANEGMDCFLPSGVFA